MRCRPSFRSTGAQPIYPLEAGQRLSPHLRARLAERSDGEGEGTVPGIPITFGDLSWWSQRFQTAGALTSVRIWGFVLLIGLFDLYQYYRRGILGSTSPRLGCRHALLHHRNRWGQFDYLPGCLVLIPLALMPLRLARPILYVVQFAGIGYAFRAVHPHHRTSTQLPTDRRIGPFVGRSRSGRGGRQLQTSPWCWFPWLPGSFLSIDRGHTRTAAIVLGISLTIKPLLLPLLVVLIIRRLWRDLTVAVAIPVALSCVALVAIAVNGSPDKFVHDVLKDVRPQTTRRWSTSRSPGSDTSCRCRSGWSMRCALWP